nr:protein Largen [Cavia porcellus]
MEKTVETLLAAEGMGTVSVGSSGADSRDQVGGSGISGLFALGSSSTQLPCPSHQVVDQIDTLTSDLQLEDELTDSSKTDTLNSSSSGTASSMEKIREPLSRALVQPSAVLTVLRKPHPPAPPPRLTPMKSDDPRRVAPTTHHGRTNGTLLHGGGLPGGPSLIPNGDLLCTPGVDMDETQVQTLTHRPEKDGCPPMGPRERVRFNEKVQYHGYCPDCDNRCNARHREVRLHGEPVPLPPGKALRRGPPPPPPRPPPFPLENGGLGGSPSHSHPPLRPATVPPPAAPRPQRTILRKSTTTTV